MDKSIFGHTARQPYCGIKTEPIGELDEPSIIQLAARFFTANEPSRCAGLRMS
jgi:hypothetical protein